MKLLFSLCAVAMCVGCATQPGPSVRDTEARLESILSEWRAMREAGRRCQDSGRHDNAQVDCGRLRDALERLAVEFPRDTEILFASAVFAHQSGEREQAQFYLDSLLNREPDHVSAANLRGRIALEEGNHPFAARLLDQAIELRPDAASLRETRAAVAYAARDWERARRALQRAARLGAPPWRLDYHHGLVSEAQGDVREAEVYYRKALELRPDWEAPMSRLRGLVAERTSVNTSNLEAPSGTQGGE